MVKEGPDIVLTDFMMPVADGLDLIWGARPVRLSAFLSKPFQMDKLLAIVERLIGKGEPQGKAVPGAV